MLQNQHLIYTLITMRKHYRAQEQECASAVTHITEQLDYVNALLADKLIENQPFAEGLLQLKAHYQTLLTQQQQQDQDAKAQVTYLNARLADALEEQFDDEQYLTLESVTVEPKHFDQTITSQKKQLRQQQPEQSEVSTNISEGDDASNLGGSFQRSQASSDVSSEEQLLRLALGASSPVDILVSSENLQHEPAPFDANQKVIKDDPAAPELSSPQLEVVASGKDTDASNKSEQQASTSSQLEEISPELLNAESLPAAARTTLLKTPLLSPYQHLSKSEAVEQLLQENEGRILHIDYIIRALHGEVEPQDLKAEKLRMNDTLRKGVEKGLWEKVPDAPGCYTINTKLIESDSKTKEKHDTTHRKSNQTNKPNAQLLPRYQDMSFTAAVATVVEEKAREVLTPEIVARALYGKIEGKALTDAKAKVGKILWNGAKQGRWKSVPGQLGMYVLQPNKIQ